MWHRSLHKNSAATLRICKSSVRIPCTESWEISITFSIFLMVFCEWVFHHQSVNFLNNFRFPACWWLALTLITISWHLAIFEMIMPLFYLGNPHSFLFRILLNLHDYFRRDIMTKKWCSMTLLSMLSLWSEMQLQRAQGTQDKHWLLGSNWVNCRCGKNSSTTRSDAVPDSAPHPSYIQLVYKKKIRLDSLWPDLMYSMILLCIFYICKLSHINSFHVTVLSPCICRVVFWLTKLYPCCE